MRRGARSPQAEQQMNMEELRVIAQKPHIFWVFYSGYISPTQVATGYNVERNEGWCIPLSLWREADKMDAKQWFFQAMQDSRLLRIVDDGIIKNNYADSAEKKWWILAPDPESNPLYGVPVRAQPPDRTELQVVQAATKATSGGPQDRVKQIKEKMKVTFEEPNAKNYQGTDEVWVATLRVQDNGKVELYPKGGNEPLFKMYKQLFNVKTQGTRFDHDPDQTSFGQYGINPLSQSMPSTNTIPIDNYVELNPDFLMIASMAIAAAQYINEKGTRELVTGNINYNTNIVPTQHLDYAQLKREKG